MIPPIRVVSVPIAFVIVVIVKGGALNCSTKLACPSSG